MKHLIIAAAILIALDRFEVGRHDVKAHDARTWRRESFEVGASSFEQDVVGEGEAEELGAIGDLEVEPERAFIVITRRAIQAIEGQWDRAGWTLQTDLLAGCQ